MIKNIFRKKKPAKKKGFFKEWFDSIVFAVVVATLVRWLVVEPYKIPTSSMEKTLLVGDFLFVSKFHYGSRNAKTLLQVPLTHQKLWGSEIPSFLEWIQIPFFRLPGISEVKKNDAVVFNTPEELELPVDMRTYLIKRCVGVAGDTLSIIDGEVHINNKDFDYHGERQHAYLISVNQTLRDRFFEQYQIRDITQRNGGYEVMTSPEKAKEISQLDFINAVTALNDKNFPIRFELGGFFRKGFESDNKKWTFNNFGPVYIPKRGSQIILTETNINIYGKLIMHYEGNEDVIISENSLSINGIKITEYEFKQDYYFMMGDNRHNSHDSRVYGFVPMDHIVGKALFTWFSLEDGPVYKFFNRIRWNRIIKEIE